MTWKAGSKKVALRVAGTSTKLSFTAKYTDTVKRVRIVFAPNGGRVSSGSKTVICGKTYGTLPTAKSGGSRIGSSSVVRTTKNQTLYARWKLVKYKIQYSLGKGANSRSNPVGYTVASRTIVLKNPVRKGYTFKGGYSDPKYKKKVTKIAAGSTGSRKLYARWVRK